MSIFNVILKALGFLKKNAGKWLPMIFAAEEKFRAGSGTEKFAMVYEIFKKEEDKILAKLDNEVKKKGETAFNRSNAKMNALADKGKKVVKEAVEYYNDLDALLPHSK